jgi:hypothetical protein
VEKVILLNKINGLFVEVHELARTLTGGRSMRKSGLTLLLVMATLAMTGCAPLVIGGAVAVVADEAIEQDKGGDGLF